MITLDVLSFPIATTTVECVIVLKELYIAVVMIIPQTGIPDPYMIVTHIGFVDQLVPVGRVLTELEGLTIVKRSMNIINATCIFKQKLLMAANLFFDELAEIYSWQCYRHVKARIIQRHWRECVSNPEYCSCRKRIEFEFGELCV